MVAGFNFVRVQQFHNHGCAVACIAMVTRKSYGSVLRRIFPKALIHDYIYPLVDLCMNVYEIDGWLRKLGVRTRLTHSMSGPTPSRSGIVLFDWHHGNWSHGVVWDNSAKRYLDPAGPALRYDIYKRAFERSDFPIVSIIG